VQIPRTNFHKQTDWHRFCTMAPFYATGEKNIQSLITENTRKFK